MGREEGARAPGLGGPECSAGSHVPPGFPSDCSPTSQSPARASGLRAVQVYGGPAGGGGVRQDPTHSKPVGPRMTAKLVLWVPVVSPQPSPARTRPHPPVTLPLKVSSATPPSSRRPAPMTTQGTPEGPRLCPHRHPPFVGLLPLICRQPDAPNSPPALSLRGPF